MLDLNIKLQLYYVKPAKNARKIYFPNRTWTRKASTVKSFADVAWLCSRVEPRKERELVQVWVCVSDLAWACDPINNQSRISGQLKKKVDLDKV